MRWALTALLCVTHSVGMNEIASIRQTANLSQSAFAEIIGVSQTTVSRWESGKSEPSRAEIAGARLLVESHLRSGTPQPAGNQQERVA